MTAKWPENLKSARAGKLMAWNLGYSAASPDGRLALDIMATTHKGGQNLARFENKEFDRIYNLIRTMPNSPERERLFYRSQAHHQCVRAVQVPRAPHPHRPGVAMGHRIPASTILARLVGLRRHRCRSASQGNWLMATRAAVVFCLALAMFGAPGHAQQPKVLRYAFPIAETGFDPAQVTDLYSRTVTPHIFDALYRYDHLARPFKIKPNTAVEMPKVSDDFRVWTIKLRPGIYFQDDPAFKGQKRELTANDYVYSFKRYFDPRWKSPNYPRLSEEGISGMAALRDMALKSKMPFDYDREVDGIRALDRYTLQFKLDEPRPRFLHLLALGDLYGAVAREVVEAYGDDIPAHPVGTGPFRLAEWRRSSRIVLERNPALSRNVLRRRAQCG